MGRVIEGPPPGFTWSLCHLLDREVDHVQCRVPCTTVPESCSSFQPFPLSSRHLCYSSCARSGERGRMEEQTPWPMTVTYVISVCGMHRSGSAGGSVTRG